MVSVCAYMLCTARPDLAVPRRQFYCGLFAFLNTNRSIHFTGPEYKLTFSLDCVKRLSSRFTQNNGQCGLRRITRTICLVGVMLLNNRSINELIC